MDQQIKENTWLTKYAQNVHSQCGEDGVIEKILETLPSQTKWCVEFGAWDGKYLSNTYNLVENHGYSCVLIEGDTRKFKDLVNTYRDNQNMVVVNRYVQSRGEDSLDNILGNTQIPADFDFLSIDIDGNDFHVWRNLENYKPKIVCIEFNPTVPNVVEFVQDNDPKVHQGSGLLSLYKLGQEKGYELVCVLKWNAIFVRKEYYPLFGIADNRPEAMNPDSSYMTYIFCGYDGKIFVRGFQTLPWHLLTYDDSDFQILPGVLRKHHVEYNSLESGLFILFTKMRNLQKRISRLFGRLRTATKRKI